MTSLRLSESMSLNLSGDKLEHTLFDKLQFSKVSNKMTSAGKNLKLSERKDRILANIIKKTHSELRQKVQESQGDESIIWKSHVKSLKENDSKDYAEAMKNLSNEHWSNESRLKWICQKLMLYFVDKDNSRFYSRIQRRQNESSESTDIDTKMVLKTL